MGRLNVIGGGGDRHAARSGITNEWAAKAFITQAQGDWDLTRLFTLGTSMHGYSTLLDESTGRISALNNGPPTGPGGNGNGGTYAGLGPLRNQINWLQPGSTSASPSPDHTLPPGAVYDISGGTLNGGTGNDHMPIFRRFHLCGVWRSSFPRFDAVARRAGFFAAARRTGTDLGQGYYRDNNAKFTDGNVYHYWGLTTVCCQGRGSAWLTRDVPSGRVRRRQQPERQYLPI